MYPPRLLFELQPGSSVPQQRYIDDVAGICEALDSIEYRRLSDPIIVPATAQDIRYDVMMSSVSGSKAYFVRAYGVGFSLAARAWREPRGRYYSFGSGLYEGRERPNILLLQAASVDVEREASRIHELLHTRSLVYEIATEPERGEGTLRGAAVIREG